MAVVAMTIMLMRETMEIIFIKMSLVVMMIVYLVMMTVMDVMTMTVIEIRLVMEVSHLTKPRCSYVVPMDKERPISQVPTET